jgi:hypothetical protein
MDITIAAIETQVPVGITSGIIQEVAMGTVEATKGFTVRSAHTYPVKQLASIIREVTAESAGQLTAAVAGALSNVANTLLKEEARVAGAPRNNVAGVIGNICGRCAPPGDRMAFVAALEKAFKLCQLFTPADELQWHQSFRNASSPDLS